jgi:DNA-binding transcriptional LysR family regulator
MHDMHIGSIDLNLLVAFDALLTEQNVTRAAERIGISQSAMSHALARLRSFTGDALLVRVRGGMVPTPRAQALGPPIQRALGDVARALSPAPAFDPKTARWVFKVGTTDYGELVLLPKLVARLAREAPGIDLRVRSLEDDLIGPLVSGSIDVALAPPRPELESQGIFARRLFDERFVCVVRKGHPLAKKKLTLSRFAAASHALISPRGREGGLVDDALARLHLKRRVAVVVPHFLIAPHVVATSDLVLTLAARVASVLAKPLGLVVLAPPAELRLEGFAMSAQWHERTQADPAQKWIRTVLADVAKTS